MLCQIHSAARLPVAALAWTLVAWHSVASQAADPKPLIERAYQLTNEAKSIDDYASIVELCQEAQREKLAADQAEYVTSLLAWSFNRRGELYTEQATAAHDAGKADQAKQLDGKAIADFEASLQLDPQRWKTWHNRAVHRAIAGKYAEAIADFSKVIELKSDYANAWFNRGEIQYDLGKIDEAIADYSHAIELNPGDAGAYASRAHAAFRQSKMEAALADYSKAVELAPENPLMLANRGDAHQSLGKWIEAAEDFRAALQLDNNSPRVLQSAAWLMATCPEADVRNDQLAVQAAERAVSLLEAQQQQPDWRYVDTLAAAYASAGRFEEAVTQGTAAVAIAPTEYRATVQERVGLYQKKQPYRQSVGEKTATAPKMKKARAS